MYFKWPWRVFEERQDSTLKDGRNFPFSFCIKLRSRVTVWQTLSFTLICWKMYDAYSYQILAVHQGTPPVIWYHWWDCSEIFKVMPGCQCCFCSWPQGRLNLNVPTPPGCLTRVWTDGFEILKSRRLRLSWNLKWSHRKWWTQPTSCEKRWLHGLPKIDHPRTLISIMFFKLDSLSHCQIQLTLERCGS